MGYLPRKFPKSRGIFLLAVDRSCSESDRPSATLAIALWWNGGYLSGNILVTLSKKGDHNV